MIQLVYPSEVTQIIRKDLQGKGVEMLPIVLPDGTVNAQAPRAFCHSPARPLHPVVHLEIINRYGEIYLQKRSAHKHLLPNCWDTAVGGHVSYGEYIEEALMREAAEELGLHEFNPIFIDSYISETERERELVNMFAIVGNFTPKPDGKEVSEGRYWSIDEIEKAIGSGQLTPLFENEYLRYKDKLLALL